MINTDPFDYDAAALGIYTANQDRDTNRPLSAGIKLPVEPLLPKGVKYDSNKPEYSLLPPVALLEMVKNLTFGAQKYQRENWRRVPDAKRRYLNAAQRHIWLWQMGETDDPENNLHHLAAAAVNLMFILELDLLDIRDEYQQFKKHLQPESQP